MFLTDEDILWTKNVFPEQMVETSMASVGGGGVSPQIGYLENQTPLPHVSNITF